MVRPSLTARPGWASSGSRSRPPIVARGYGRHLVSEVLKCAREHGISLVQVQTAVTNQPALAFTSRLASSPWNSRRSTAFPPTSWIGLAVPECSLVMGHWSGGELRVPLPSQSVSGPGFRRLSRLTRRSRMRTGFFEAWGNRRLIYL